MRPTKVIIQDETDTLDENVPIEQQDYISDVIHIAALMEDLNDEDRSKCLRWVCKEDKILIEDNVRELRRWKKAVVTQCNKVADAIRTRESLHCETLRVK